MKKALFLFFAMILMVSCSQLDLSVHYHDASVTNNTAQTVLISIEPYQSPKQFKMIAPNGRIGWIYEATENCIMHLSIYSGPQLTVDGHLVLDIDKIMLIGDYPFELGENYTEIKINEGFEVIINTDKEAPNGST